jgi:hypothetical protein
VTGRASMADWTSAVQFVRWWWNGGRRIPFVGSKVWLSSCLWRSQGWLNSAFFWRFLGLAEVPGRRLRVSFPPWGHRHGTARVAPPRAPGETLDSACRIGHQRHHGVVPSLEVLSRSLVESPEGHDGVQVGGRLERWLPVHNVRCRRRFLVDIFQLVWSHRLPANS